MNIKFNVVTWYSKLLSIIFFIAVLPIWTFYIGMKVKEVEVYANPSSLVGLEGSSLSSLMRSGKNEHKVPKIDVGESVLEGKVFGMVQSIFEKDGKIWANIDPADEVSPLECVFRAYDANISQSCDAPNSMTTWNISTSTIAMPLSEKASISVYYNDGTKIGLKPKVLSSKNGKLYQFSLASSPNTLSSAAPVSASGTSAAGASSNSTPADLAASYNRILSYDGDNTYRWNPLMSIDIKKGDAKLGENPEKSYVVSIEEVWRP